jgi:hypothetical protein
MEKEEFLKVLSEHPQFLPDILQYLHTMITDYMKYCERQNNIMLREALGDAVHLLGMKKKPKDMKRACTRIENAIFRDGLCTYHHEGERQFYNRYLKI